MMNRTTTAVGHHRDQVARDGPDPCLRQARRDKEGAADRRRVEGDGEIGRDHDPEVHQVDLEGHGHGEKKRGRQEHGRQRLDENAQEKQGDVEKNQKHPGLVRHAPGPIRRAASATCSTVISQARQPVAPMTSSTTALVWKAFRMIGGRSRHVMSLYKNREMQQPVDHGDRRRLGGRELPGPDAADDDDGHDQGGPRRLEGCPDLARPRRACRRCRNRSSCHTRCRHRSGPGP